jgi:perosamine synthetase
LLLGRELLAVPEEFPNLERSWFVYFVRFLNKSPAELRDRVRRSLREKGIASQIYFTPIHQQPFFEHCNPKAVSCLNQTNLAGKQCLALPFHSRLTESEVEFVCDELLAALESASRDLAAPRIELAPASTVTP